MKKSLVFGFFLYASFCFFVLSCGTTSASSQESLTAGSETLAVNPGGSITRAEQVDFAAAPKFSRRVVSFEMAGQETVASLGLDHVELEWWHETESWMKPPSDIWKDDEVLDDFFKVQKQIYMERYNDVLANPGKYYTLKMTVSLKGGGSLVFTCIGGVSSINEDGTMTIRWDWSWNVQSGALSTKTFEGTVPQDIANTMFALMGDFAEINWETPNPNFRSTVAYLSVGVNKMRFENVTEGTLLGVELDGSFFPD